MEKKASKKIHALLSSNFLEKSDVSNVEKLEVWTEEELKKYAIKRKLLFR